MIGGLCSFKQGLKCIDRERGSIGCVLRLLKVNVLAQRPSRVYPIFGTSFMYGTASPQTTEVVGTDGEQVLSTAGRRVLSSTDPRKEHSSGV